MNALQELDKDCLDQNIEQLIVLTNESKQLESKIEYVKEAIKEYATENGVIYSDSSHSVSLVYTPVVEWDDEQIENCELHISQFEEQIKAIKAKQDAFKEMRKARISELQSEIKANCIKENVGINQIHSEFTCIKSFKDAFQVRIAKSKISQKTQKHESDFERSWIYKKN